MHDVRQDPHRAGAVAGIDLDERDAARALPPAALQRMADAVTAAEQGHLGEICIVVEASLTPLQLLQQMSARERALEVFAQSRSWDTEHNSGVLVYLLLADHAVEILADRGLHPKGADFWPQAVERFRHAFASDDTTTGCIAAIKRGWSAVDQIGRAHV